MRTVKMVFPLFRNDLGIKVSNPRPMAALLGLSGWLFDTVAGTVSVTAENLQKAIEVSLAVLQADSSRSLHARQLAETAGLLCHIGEVFLQMRRRLHPIWCDLNENGVYHMWQHCAQADPLFNCQRIPESIWNGVAGLSPRGQSALCSRLASSSYLGHRNLLII